MAFQDYFSVVAFFIFLRETLEASVIIAVLLQCMNRTYPRLKRQVWFGALSGIGVSVIFGGIFAVVYYVARTILFQGNAKAIFQGVISYVACILITWLGFAMLRFANIEKKWARKLDNAAHKALVQTELGARKHRMSVFVLAFTAVVREGVEAVIFLAGVGANTGIASIPLACLAGLVVGLSVGLAIYYAGRTIKDLRIFFIISTVVLFFIAAGQVSIGTGVLSTAGAFGPYATWEEDLTWQYQPITDLSYCCSDLPTAPNPFFPLLKAVFGYQAKPTPIVIGLYCTYWALVIGVALFKWRRGSLFDAEHKRTRELRRLQRGAAAAQRRLARCERQVERLQGKVDGDTAAAAGHAAAGDGALGGHAAALGEALQRRVKLAAAAEAAAAAAEAEAARLNEEDEAAALRMGMAGGDATVDVVGVSGELPPAAAAAAGSKDVELGVAVRAEGGAGAAAAGSARGGQALLQPGLEEYSSEGSGRDAPGAARSGGLRSWLCRGDRDGARAQ